MRILLLTIRLLAGCVALQSMSSYAQDVPGWYIGASTGRTNSGLTQDDVTALAGGWNASPTIDVSSSAYKLFGGYRVSPSFSIEGGYVDLGKVNFNSGIRQSGCSGPIPCPSPLSPVIGVRKVHSAQVSVVGTLPCGNQFSLIGQLGLMISEVTLQSHTQGVPTLSEQLAGMGGPVARDLSEVTVRRTTPAIGIGIRYAFTPQISARLNWEQFRNVGDSAKTGAREIDLISLGVEYYF